MIRAVISDMHIKESNGKLAQQLFAALIPLKEKYKIENVVLLGDVYNQRAIIRTELQRILVKGIAQLVQAGLTIDVVVGNHDYDSLDNMKHHSLEVLSWLFSEKVNVYSQNTLVGSDLFLPYSTDLEAIRTILVENKSVVKNVFCHLPITEFMFTATHKESKGALPEWFSHVQRVFAGHFHLQQTKDNIIYPGAVFVNSFAESDIVPHIIIYDNELDTVEYISVADLIVDLPMYHSIKIDSMDFKLPNQQSESHRYRFIVHMPTLEECKVIKDTVTAQWGESARFQFQYKTEKLERERIPEHLSVEDMFMNYIDNFYKEELKDHFNLDDTQKKGLKDLGLQYIKEHYGAA